MAKASKLPSGNWRVQARYKNEKRSFTAETRREAEFLALEWQTERKKANRPENRTVADAMQEYIDERSNVLSPSTIAGYRKIKRNYFTDLQPIKIKAVDRHDIQLSINEMATRLSPKTIQNAVFFLQASCGFNFDLSLPKKEKKIYRTPGVEGIRHILAQTKGTDIEVPVLLALWCGLRMSEVRGLRFDHVFPDHILIDRAMVHAEGEDVIKMPKNGASRIVNIPRILYDRIMADNKNGSEYVTTIHAIMIYKKFVRLTGGICRFHDLRHANASVMLALGVPDNYAMNRCGWETESIYKKTYGQVMPESADESACLIDSFFINLWQNDHEKDHDKD